MNKKSDSEKYNELYEAVLNMKKQRDEEIKELKDKEIKLLKEKIENLEKLLQIKSINNIEKDDKYEGTKLEIFTIGKDDYYDYFPTPNQYDKKLNGILLTLIFECNENDIQGIIDSFMKNKDEIKTRYYKAHKYLSF